MTAATAAQRTASLRSQRGFVRRCGFVCSYNKEWRCVCVRVCGIAMWVKMGAERVVCVRRKLSVCGFNVKD